MAIALAASASAAALSYWRSETPPGPWKAAAVGGLWMALAIALDAPFFLFGPAQMRLSIDDYASDIGLGYVLIPIICVAIALSAKRR